MHSILFECLEKYIRAHDWKVGYQFEDKSLPDDPIKKLPTNVAQQFELIQKAKTGEISYEKAELEIKGIGLKAAQQNNSFKNRFLGIR